MENNASNTAGQLFNLPVEEWQAWLNQVMQPAALTQLAVIMGAAVLAWIAVRLLRRAVLSGPQKNAIPDAVEKMAQRVCQNEKSLLFGRKDYDGVLFPLSGWAWPIRLRC